MTCVNSQGELVHKYSKKHTLYISVCSLTDAVFYIKNEKTVNFTEIFLHDLSQTPEVMISSSDHWDHAA